MNLEGLDQIKITQESISDQEARFVIEPLLPGYGMTVGHALRRVILNSLRGAAVSYVKIDGADHEFATLKGMKEDVVDLILNLKTLRVRSESEEPVVIKLSKKGAGKVTAADFEASSDVEIIDKDHYLTTLDKDGKLSMEVTIERGRGYITTEQKVDEKLPLGTIAVDSIFSPIKKIHYEVTNTRVGGQTDYDKLTLEITTDGTVTPAEAFEYAAEILVNHFSIVKEAVGQLASEAKPKKAAAKKPAKAKTKKSK